MPLSQRLMSTRSRGEHEQQEEEEEQEEQEEHVAAAAAPAAPQYEKRFRTQGGAWAVRQK